MKEDWSFSVEVPAFCCLSRALHTANLCLITSRAGEPAHLKPETIQWQPLTKRAKRAKRQELRDRKKSAKKTCV